MFNEERKVGFIEDCVMRGAGKTERLLIGRLFSRLEEFESAYGVDISDMTQEQVEAVFGSDVFRASRFYTSICVLRSYAAWCIRNGFASSDAGIFRVRPEGLEDTRNRMVSGSFHLERLINVFLTPVEDGRSDNIIRAFIWILWAGLPSCDAVLVKTKDTDPDKRIIRYGGKKYVLDPLSVPAIRFAVDSESVRIDHPIFPVRKRADSPFLLRLSNENPTVKWLTSYLRQAQKEAGNNGGTASELVSTNIFKSGRFSDMLLAERAGVFPDFSLDVEAFMKSETRVRSKQGYHLNGENAYQTNFKNLSARFLEEYSRWKLAFLPD